jgi:bile acid:Na+ symporter, BASS family
VKLQQVLAIVLLVSLMFNAGLQVNPSKFVSILRAYRIILRALVANFIIVPLGAFLIVTVLRLDDLVATGMLLMAIAPGVPFVILAGGRAKGGSHDLAVALAVILPLLSFLTIPITAQFILPTEVRAEVPESQLFGLLTFQIVPLLLGTAAAAIAPRAAEKLTVPIGRLTMVSLLALFAALVPAIVRSLFGVIGTRGILAAIAIDVFSLAVGSVFGGRQPSERFTFAIGTALRNPGLAMLIATRLPETVVPASVTVYFLVQFLGATIFGGKSVRAFALGRTPG